MGKYNRIVVIKLPLTLYLFRYVLLTIDGTISWNVSQLTYRRLKDFGIKDEDIKQLVEMGFEAWQQCYESISNQPHNDESMWFLKDCSRHNAEELLRGSPTGTFLIRARSAGHYALSIVCKDLINHCIIYKTESGYGFAAPYNIYHTLKKLVEHYASNSLEEHNDTLTTTLRIPVVYWHQNKDLILQQLQEELDLDREHRLQLEMERLDVQSQVVGGGAGGVAPTIPSLGIPSAPIEMMGGSASGSASACAGGCGSGSGSGLVASSQTPPAATPPSAYPSPPAGGGAVAGAGVGTRLAASGSGLEGNNNGVDFL